MNPRAELVRTLYGADPLLCDALAEVAEKCLAVGKALEVNVVTEREESALAHFVALADRVRQEEES